MISHRWSFGSVLFLASWAVLMGPVTYAKHLVSGPRLPFTLVYFGSIFLTLFSAMKVCHILPYALPLPSGRWRAEPLEASVSHPLLSDPTRLISSADRAFT